MYITILQCLLKGPRSRELSKVYIIIIEGLSACMEALHGAMDVQYCLHYDSHYDKGNQMSQIKSRPFIHTVKPAKRQEKLDYAHHHHHHTFDITEKRACLACGN